MTVTYRNKYQNYYQDKGGQHQPPGTILPVLVDVNSGAANEIEEYSHQGYLYCDGRELNIRDYPILYKAVRNTYGGNTTYSPQQSSSPGGLRKLFWINDKAFLNFYRDPGIAADSKIPYPYGSSVRFVGQTTQFTGNISAGSPDITAVPSTDINKINVGDVVELMGNNGTVTLPVNSTVLSKDPVAFSVSLSNSFGGSGAQVSAQFGIGVGFGSIGPGVFEFNNYYQTKLPTEDVSAQVDPNEFCYEIVFPEVGIPGGVDPATLPQFTVNFTSGGAVHPNITLFKSFNTRDTPRSIGTFFLPDYRDKVVVGYGAVDGLGSATVEDGLNNTVGQIGGSWYIAQNQLLNGGIFFDIGNVKTTGYTGIQADISTFITGSVSTTVGPIDDHIFSRPIEHYHNILSSEPDESLAVEFGGSPSDKYGVIYSKSRSNVIPFEPSVSGGVALGHSHGLSATMLNDGNMATYGNTDGIGLDDGGNPKKWNVTSAPSINITSITYDAPNDKCIVATAVPHGYNPGDWVTVQGATPVEYNGSFVVLTSGLSTQGFEYDPTSDSQPNPPGTSPAGGNPIVKLASGTFDEVTAIPQPRFYAINQQTVVGGKATVIINPGTGVTFQQEDALIPSTITMDPVPASSGEVTQIDITLMAPGGGGADSDNSGGDAGFAYATFTVDGTTYTVTANGGDGGTAGNVGGQALLQTRDWLAVGNLPGGGQNISSGAAAVWSTFLLNNGIYPDVPSLSGTDPNLNTWIEGGVGIDVDASLAASGFNVEFHADGSSELDLFSPSGAFIQGNATPPNTSGPGVPYTSNQTLVVPAGNLTTLGWYQLTFKVKNDSAANNTWDQNPGGIGFIATRADNGSQMFNSRDECTGGITTTTAPGTGGGAGGSGGAFSYPPSLDGEDWFSISTNTTGLDGDDGGTQGTDQSETNGGGDTGTTPKPIGSGGDGGANGFSTVVDLGTQSFTAFNDTWNNPPQIAGETSRNVTLSVAGAGGANGNPNANSGCEAGSTQPPFGDGSAIGGIGTNGALITATLASVPNTITMQIGRAGEAGENVRGGYANGTGYESDSGGSQSVGGNGPAVGGNSGLGAWGNGATGGAGGGATGVYFNGGNVFIGAGGGGGGGGSGGGYNGGGTTDGCYAGGNGQGAGTNLHSMTTAMDFVNGADGTQGGCTAGGGGGGGGGCGPSGSANGGEGGQAGVGHNGNGGGEGGARGDSAYRSDMCVATFNGNGPAPGNDGFVSISTTVNATQFGFNGGGGGQGAVAIVSLAGKNIAITAGLQSPGNGGGTAEDGANGYINVRYAGSEGGGTTPGNPSIPQGKYYLCDQAGVPSGSAFDGDIWQTSTNDDMVETVPGPGSTATDKFAINAGAGAPSYGGIVTKYLPWIGDSSANNLREYYVGPFNLSNVNNLRFTVIRGNGSNGGAIPEEDLMVYWQLDGSNTTTLLNTIVPASTTSNDWDFYDIALPEANNIRQNGVYLYLRQNRTSGQDDNSNDAEDNYGLAGIHLFYDEETNQVFTPADGSLIGGIDQIDSTITPIDASMLAGDGKFTMSSSTPITTSVVASPENNIPLITRYHRVKYLIKAI